jgi:hypothetical protein
LALICVRIPIKATAREPIKQAGYNSGTSAIYKLSCETQPVHHQLRTWPLKPDPFPVNRRIVTKMTSGRREMHLLAAGHPLLASWHQSQHWRASLFHLLPQDRLSVVTVEAHLFRGKGR